MVKLDIHFKNIVLQPELEI